MNLKLVTGAAMVLGMLLVSCGSPPTTTTEGPDAVTSAQATAYALAAAQPSGNIPAHFTPEPPAEIVRGEGDFDVNAYFGVLAHLSVEPGWVIDYFYRFDGMGGGPFLYARPADRAPYTSLDEFIAGTADHDADGWVYELEYLSHVRTDDTRDGYFQLVALMMMGDQFYLFWHSGYNDTAIVADKEALEKTLTAAASAFENVGVPKSVQDRARKVDLTPTVAFPDASTAVVRVVTFSMWGGFAESKYTISRQYPHAMISKDTKILIEYDCGVQF